MTLEGQRYHLHRPGHHRSPGLPLVYNGTTYLPLASLSQLLGAEVSWDQNTQTILIHDNDSASDYIGEAKAKEIALSHAGCPPTRPPSWS